MFLQSKDKNGLPTQHVRTRFEWLSGCRRFGKTSNSLGIIAVVPMAVRNSPPRRGGNPAQTGPISAKWPGRKITEAAPERQPRANRPDFRYGCSSVY